MVYVAIGSNLADLAGRAPLDLCRWAVGRIAAEPRLQLRAVSRWYRTAPVPASDQPDYINGVVALEGEVEPAALLVRLHAIEAEAGRRRTVANAPRVLDLDLLAVDGRCSEADGVLLPHPRLHERAFVLYPLCDVAADWVHPRLGRTARALLDGVAGQRIECLAETSQPLPWRQQRLT